MEIRDAAVEYYIKNKRLEELYHAAENRVRAYLDLLFQRSYALFVLHDAELSKSFLPMLFEVREQLTVADLKVIASAHREVPLSSCMGWIATGDTVEALLWEMAPNETHRVSEEETPKALRKWAEGYKEKYEGQTEEAIYDLKYVFMTFKYDDRWYRLGPGDIGTNDIMFETLSRGMEAELHDLGAMWIVYHGDID